MLWPLARLCTTACSLACHGLSQWSCPGVLDISNVTGIGCILWYADGAGNTRRIHVIFLPVSITASNSMLVFVGRKTSPTEFSISKLGRWITKVDLYNSHSRMTWGQMRWDEMIDMNTPQMVMSEIFYPLKPVCNYNYVGGYWEREVWFCWQECPKCQATIEKDGGCNHMVCKRCKYDFCWICLTAWEPHGSSWSAC